MNAEQFAYWLQGYAELTEDAPSPEQWASIKAHLRLVFNKVTPPIAPQFKVGGTSPLGGGQLVATPSIATTLVC